MSRLINVAVLSLTGITACKLVLFLLLFKGGYLQPYIGTMAEDVFLPAADRILKTGTYNDPETSGYSIQAPGYSFFLALAEWVSTKWYLPLLVCLQMVLDYCIALFLLFLGKFTTSIQTGWLAGGVWLIFPPAIVISTWVTSETLFTALLILSVTLLILTLSEPGAIGVSFIAGLILGLATLVRGTTLFLPILFFVIAGFQGLRKPVTKCTVFFIGMCLCVLPWTLRNIYVLGEPIIVQTSFGSVFLQGSRSEWFSIDGMMKSYLPVVTQAAQEGLVEPKDRKATSRERWRTQLALRNYRIRLAEEPFSFFPFVIHKFAYLWYGMQTEVFYKQLILGACSLLVVPIAVVQIWLWRREKLHLTVTFSLLLLYFIGLHLVTAPEFRYMLPIYPFLIFSASHQYARLLTLRSAQVNRSLQSAAHGTIGT